MDLKTKKLIKAIIVGCVILIGIIGYMAYFVANDTLDPTPKDAVAKNLFIEKDSIDIANLRKKENLIECRNLYYTIWNSIYEERLNGFLGENQQANEKQYQTLWKRLNSAYTEQFIALTARYFAQQIWDDNVFVNQCITDIKKVGFVESNTPIWNSLQGFENSINWYNATQNCISDINDVIRRMGYFRGNNLSAITLRINNLSSEKCRQNSNILSELNKVYENLKNSSYNYLYSKIKQYRNDFNILDNTGKDEYKDTANRKNREVISNVEQWDALFHNSYALQEQLERHKEELDTYYTK